jgi:hypothetical protein
MDNSPPRPSRRYLAAVLLVAVLVLGARVAVAEAATYCVADPGCPAGGVAESTLEQAVTAADQDAVPDTVRIGPGTFSAPWVYASEPVTIVGAGIGATTLEAPPEPGIFGDVISLTAGCKISDLTVRLRASRQHGVRLSEGADVARFGVVAAHDLAEDTGIAAEDQGSDIRSVKIDLGPNLSTYGISDLGESTVEDADITAGLGLSPSAAGTTARRLTIHAHEGFYIVGGSLNAANALLLPYLDDEPTEFEGAMVTGGNAGGNASLTLADTTIVGPDPAHGIGVDAIANFSANSGAVNVNLQGVAIADVGHSIYRKGKSATQTAVVATEYSAFDGAKVSNPLGSGTIVLGAGNLTGGVDPRFVDPAAGDYRPSFESPLLDAGPPMLPLAGDDPDLSGRSRVRDSDGNGSAVRDIGAYEYQRLAPVPALTVSPPSAAPGEPLGFSSADSIDPDGDPVSYAWSFGDGADGAGPTASHAYAAPGTFAPSLTLTDATGLSATATGSVGIAVPPPTPGAGTDPAGGASSASTSDGGVAGANPAARRPALTDLRQSARRWLPAGVRARKGAPLGTTFRFSLDTAASVRFAFSRRVGKRWVPAGMLVRPAAAGADKVRFSGRLSTKRTLRPGRYKVTVTAADVAGRSAPHSLRFVVL